MFLQGYDDIVALLLRAGAPVNCRVTEDSSTPLHKACAGSKPGHLSAVKQLLEGGADVHALNKWRETPLLTAANHGQAGAVEALLRSGADPCKCTDTGWSPLSIAAYKGHDGVVKLLLEEGAPTEEADPTLSAVLQAATKGLPDTVELLLRHGADHTVTTKKGDTALSILVEQNLIDAAVEMVTEYKASIPRCSRDRKKVQRARLLINLRMKQHQRDGKHVSGTEDDDETDEEEDGSKSPQHDNDDSLTSGSGPDNKKEKKKGKKSKLTLEEQARQAEEALLLELEQEDAKAKKEEAEANSKRAKKKKKKERERQQKLKEEQERREKEEKEAQERERIRKEKEERERKERQQKLKEQREREMKEAAERERIAAAKRKEKEGKERKQLEQEQKQKAKQEKKVTAATSPSGSVASDNRNKMAMAKAKVAPNKKAPVNNTTTDRNGTTERAIKKQMPAAKAQAPQGAMSQPVVQGKNRGWETKAKPAPNQAEPAKPAPAMKPISKPDSSNKGTPRGFSNEPRTPILPPPTSADSAIPSTFLASSTSDFPSGQAGSAFAFDKSASSETPYLNSMGTKNQSPPALNPDTFSNAVDRGLPLNFNVGSVEHPAVGLYRHEKVTELLQRCRMSVGVVDELALRRVFYRWIVRASHSQSPYLDCIIPSWADFEQLAAFFQRQFITESRKGTRGSGGADMVNMETLREAGSSMANVCHSQAKEVVQFRLRMEQQLPRDWNDASLGMRASDIRNNGGIGVVVDWAGQSKLYFSAEEFTTLRTRYVGQPNRFLTSIFAVKTRYETKRMVMGDTNLDFRLSLETKRCLSAEASVSAEFCADPVSALTTNVFWGNFEDVDSPFGGLVPFAKDDAGSEELLYRHGGSVSVLLPFDNMVASKYTRQMLDILQECDAKGTPISFVVFVHADSFHDLNGPPTIRDLHLLDPRLGVNYSYLRQVEALSPSQHLYFSGEGTGVSKISPEGGLIMLLQNDSAKQSYPVSEASLAKIKHSMSTVVPAPAGLLSPIGFSGEFVPRESPTTPQSGYFDALPPISPTPQHQPQPQTAMMDFGTIGGSDIQKAFSPTETSRRAAPRRGRLFELVDDGEEEHLNDVDVVSGMLNNLNVDLFQNNVSQDVDIEAISLMGIGGPPSTRSLPPGNSHSTGRYG